MTLLTCKRVTGLISAGGTTDPGTTGFPGWRYALFIQKPSCSLSSTRMEVTHLTHESPAHPGTTILTGYPWPAGKDSPFISNASNVLGSSAFLTGIDRWKS